MQELEVQALRSELTLLRSQDKLRTEHQQDLVKEAEVMRVEQKRVNKLIQELKNHHQAEQEHLLKKELLH